jgi:hypothetical protein
MDLVIGRITNFVVDRASGDIFAGDDRGLVYRLSPDLMSVQRSAGTSHGVVIHAMTLDDHCLYTRDVAGNLVQWDRLGLYPLNFVLTQHCTETAEDGTPVPSPSNALVSYGSSLLVSNSLGTLSLFEREGMRFQREVNAAPDAFPERVTVHEGALYVSDVGGNLHKGDLDANGFRQIASVPGGVIHSMTPDPLHDRIWCTSDITGGVFFVDREGALQGELRLTNDDVEEIAFDSKGQYAYVGCFDHHVHVVKNQTQPVEVGCIGPFKFQINHIALLDDRRLLVLLESGELNLVDTADGRVLATAGGTNAIWNFCLVGSELVGAAENGNLESFHICARGRSLSLIRGTPGPFLSGGRVRQIKPLRDGWVCGTSDGSIVSIDSLGEQRWRTATGSIVRDLDVDPESGDVVVCNEIGEVLLLRGDDGTTKTSFKNGKPVWCVAFADDGGIVFGERTLMAASGPREASHLVFLDRAMTAPPMRLARFGNHKRLRRLGGHRMLVTGNGSIGVQFLDTRAREVVATYSDWIINTPENAVVHGDRLYAVTYGYQLITYELASGRALDVKFIVEGYPTALEVYQDGVGATFLLLAGRNVLMAFLLNGDAPELVCTRYLYDTLPQDTRFVTDPVARREPTNVLACTLLQPSMRQDLVKEGLAG